MFEEQKKAMEDAFARMKECGRSYKEAMESGDDSDEAKALVAAEEKRFEKAKTDWANKKKSLEDAIAEKKAEEQQKALTDQAASFDVEDVEGDETDVPVDKGFGTGAQKTTPAEGKDWSKEMGEKTSIFNKYLAHGVRGLTGNEADAVRPNSDSFKDGASGVIAPPHIKAGLFGLRWMKSMGLDREVEFISKGSSTMVSGTDALGGYTVPEDYRLPVIELPGEEPIMLNRVTTIPAPTGTVTMPRAQQTDSDEYGGFSGDWISEGGLKNKADTRFEQVQINTHEYAAYTQLSVRLLERSAIAMEAWVNRKGRAKLMNELNRVILRGTGSSQPTGMINTAGIHQQGRATANDISRTDLVNLKRQIQPYHRQGGMFILSDDAGGTLENLTVSTTDKRPLFAASMANGPYDRLLGYPYMETTQLPDTGSEGDVIFVDPREYYLAMESDVVIKRSDDYDIVHNLATIVIYMVVGGQLVEPRVMAELDDATTS